MNAIIPAEPCAHPLCGCKVEPGQKYCNDACHDQATKPGGDDTCACGHSDCIIEQAAAQLVPPN